MNCRNRGKVNSKNNLRQHIHACCFGAKLGMCVLKKAVENLVCFLKCQGTQFLETFKPFFAFTFAFTFQIHKPTTFHYP